jgi:rod shape-determining protein MreC
MSLREGPLQDLKVPLSLAAALAAIVAVVAAIALLISSRREPIQEQAYGAGRVVSDRVIGPTLDVLSLPGQWLAAANTGFRNHVFVASENQRLRREVAELRQWRNAAIALEDINARYRDLLGLKIDPPIAMVTARVVLDSRGPFANTRLANAGAEKGVVIGNPVMSETGLVGRVVGVGNGISRILLLTDAASHIPVLIDRTNARAILTGDGGPNPTLEYLRGPSAVQNGDRVLTSGDGGVIPRGLPVGTAVKGLDGRWRIRLAADNSAVDFVRILQFKGFADLANQAALAQSAMPVVTDVNPAAVPAPVPGPAPAPAQAPVRAPIANAAPATVPVAQGVTPQ